MGRKDDSIEYAAKVRQAGIGLDLVEGQTAYQEFQSAKFAHDKKLDAEAEKHLAQAWAIMMSKKLNNKELFGDMVRYSSVLANAEAAVHQLKKARTYVVHERPFGGNWNDRMEAFTLCYLGGGGTSCSASSQGPISV